MRLPGRFIFSLLPFLLVAAPASAQPIRDDWQCGRRIEVTAALLTHFTSSYASSEQADMPAFVAGTLKSEEGATLSVLFIHGATGWRGRVDFSQARPPACFVSKTKDGGKSWSVPQQTQPCAGNNDPEADLRSSVE